MIKVNKIYILCPSQLNTGGPLAMHQLGNKLKELNHDVNMYYLPITENPVHDNYLNYNVPFVKQVEDSAKNLIIAPEVWTEKLTLFKKIQKSIWWLSIDNFYASSKPIINKIIDMIKGERRFKWNHFSSYYHFTQSEYANQYLKKKSLESVYMLSDYIDKKFIEKDPNPNRTIVSKEFPQQYKKGREPFYPVNNEENNIRYSKYENATKTLKNIHFGGRLAKYKYYDMHQVIGSALSDVEKIVKSINENNNIHTQGL